LLPGLAACAAANIPILLDLDAAYDHMPITHPDYPRLGLGTPGAAKAFRAALQLADRVVVPSEALAAILRAAGSSEVDVIPEGWTRANPLWEKPAARRHSLNIGWLGQGGGLDDVAPVRRMIVRVLREFQQTQLIVIGDPQVYQLFDSVPEARRLFLPAVKQEDYPYLLGQIDILIAPYRSTPFNQALSDHQLLEAGIRQIPWIASPLPAFTAWEAGGIIAQSPDEWHTHLRQLVLDPSLRQNLGRMGRLKAAGREMGALGRMWAELIEVCFAENILLE
jgi:glycosyltransferase involved in cell wall biosynthesis